MASLHVKDARRLQLSGLFWRMTLVEHLVDKAITALRLGRNDYARAVVLVHGASRPHATERHRIFQAAGVDLTGLHSLVVSTFLLGNPPHPSASPQRGGGRFCDTRTGAWYASGQKETAFEELLHHHRVRSQDSGKEVAERIAVALVEAKIDMVCADVTGIWRVARDRYDLVDYAPSQDFAEHRWPFAAGGIQGVLYDSVRRAHGTNVVAYNPLAVVVTGIDRRLELVRTRFDWVLGDRSTGDVLWPRLPVA